MGGVVKVAVPQRSRPQRVELAFRRALRLIGGASLLAAASHEDILVRLAEASAKSPYEAERRLRA